MSENYENYVVDDGGVPKPSSSGSDFSAPPANVGSISVSQQIIASSVGALATSLMVTPMDVVKIRMQQQVQPIAQGECFLYSNGLMDHLCTNCADPFKPSNKCEWYNRPGNFNGTLDALIKITRYEGIRSLWSGLSPTMLSAIPATVFYFTIYDNILYSLRKYAGDRLYVPMLAGTLARTISVSFVSPLELIRTKMQSKRHSYKELISAVQRTVSHDGYMSLWRGLGATLFRDIPFSAIYWTGYELFKKKTLRETGKTETNFMISFLCGASAGTIAAAITTPFDVVKTHQQITLGKIMQSRGANGTSNSGGLHSNGKCSVRGKIVLRKATSGIPNGGGASSQSLWGVMRGLVEAKGVSALFAGFVPRIARVAPACATMIGSYEYLKLFFIERNAQKKLSGESPNV